jgi:hypothetical protein
MQPKRREQTCFFERDLAHGIPPAGFALLVSFGHRVAGDSAIDDEPWSRHDFEMEFDFHTLNGRSGFPIRHKGQSLILG